MSEHTVDKQTMDSLEALANMNMKISETRANLVKLKELEMLYIAAREKKAVARIHVVLEESRTLLEQTKANHDGVKEFAKEVGEFASFFSGAYREFESMVRDFEAKNKLWEVGVKKREEELAFLRRDIETEKVRIVNSKKSLDSQMKVLNEEQRHITDQRGVLERMIERLGQNRI